MNPFESDRLRKAISYVSARLQETGRFVACLIVSFAIVLGLVFIVFSIHPNRAYVYTELQDSAHKAPMWSASELSADIEGDALMGDVAAIIAPQKDEIVSVHFAGFTIDEIPNVKDATLILKATNSIGSSKILLEGDIEHAILSSASVVDSYDTYNGLCIPESIAILCIDSVFFTSDTITITIPDSLCAYIHYDDGSEDRIEDRVSTLTFRSDLADGPFDSVDNASSRGSNAVEQPSIMQGLTVQTSPEATPTRIAVFLPRSVKIESQRVCSLVSTSSGKFSISFTPHKEDYELQAQELRLTSSENGLSCSYDGSQHMLIASGYAQSATLCGMDLFPSFLNWYYSNTYIAPLTVISSVIAANAQFSSYMKQQGSSVSTDAEKRA